METYTLENLPAMPKNSSPITNFHMIINIKVKTGRSWILHTRLTLRFFNPESLELAHPRMLIRDSVIIVLNIRVNSSFKLDCENSIKEELVIGICRLTPLEKLPTKSFHHQELVAAALSLLSFSTSAKIPWVCSHTIFPTPFSRYSCNNFFFPVTPPSHCSK